MSIVKWWKARQRARRLKVLPNRLASETGTELVHLVIEAFTLVGGERLGKKYHRSFGELIRVEFSNNPLALLTATEELAEIIQRDAYLPNTFVFGDRRQTNLDSWLTVDGAYVRGSLWYPLMQEATENLLKALLTADICAMEKRDYYQRRSKMLMLDLAELARVLVALEDE